MANNQEQQQNELAERDETTLVNATNPANMQHQEVGGTQAEKERKQIISELEDLGEYENIQHIGSGGFGHVFRADNLPHKRLEALKVLQKSSGIEGHEKFKSGLRIQANTRTLGIPLMYYSRETEHYHFFAMEYVEGDNLDAYIDKNELSFQQRIELIWDLCDLIEAFHNEVNCAHRDIKPENIKVDQTGKVWLLDFDLAKKVDKMGFPNNSIPGAGSFGYRAPEQQHEDGEITVKTDVFPLGIIAFEILSLRFRYRPFFANANLKEVNELKQILFDDLCSLCTEQKKDVLKQIALVIAPALTTDQEKRPSVNEFKAGFQGILNNLSGQGSNHPSSGGKRFFIAIALLLVGTFGIYSIIKQMEIKETSPETITGNPKPSILKPDGANSVNGNSLTAPPDKPENKIIGNKPDKTKKGITKPPPPQQLMTESQNIKSELTNNPELKGKGALLYTLPSRSKLIIKSGEKVISTVDSRLQSGGTLYKSSGEKFQVILQDLNGKKLKSTDWNPEAGKVELFY